MINFSHKQKGTTSRKKIRKESSEREKEKEMKRRIAIVLAAVMAVAMVGTAMADSDEKSVNLSYSVGESYEWTVPSETTTDPIELIEGDMTIGDVSVTKCLIGLGKKLTIAVSSGNGWKLKESDDNDTTALPYTLNADEAGVLTVSAGVTDFTSTVKNLKATLSKASAYAGTFTDTLTFTASVDDVN